MASLIKKKGRKKGSKGNCSYCEHVKGILNQAHNIRTCPMKKADSEKEEKPEGVVPTKSVSTPPQDNTPHFDEQYSVALTPSRSPSYLRRSRRVEQRQNALPSETQTDKLSSWFSKKCNIWDNDEKPSAKSYGDCLICLETMYKGDIMVLGCGHKLHTKCAEKLYRRGDNKCPECRLPGVFTMLTRPEPPKDNLKSLQIENNRQLQEIVILKKQLKKAKEEKKLWERDARLLWNEFVTDEMKNLFPFTSWSKRYI